MLLWVDVGYACGGVIFKNGIAVHSAPIFKWMKGKTTRQVLSWKRIKRYKFLSEGN